MASVRARVLVAVAIATAVLAPVAAAEWGGRTATPAGEPVTIFLSDAYPQDPALQARWAAFLGSLIHGPEISTVTVQIAPRREIARLCGFTAAACYSPSRRTIVAPGEDPPNGPSAEAILAHEYGHHVAASRVNSPWRAVDWGTKRWASHLQVCRGVDQGLLFPGPALDPRQYAFNPAEVFAESYRLLNERRAGRPESPWEVVSRTLYPDDTALAMLEQDILSPWHGPTVSIVRGSFSRAGRAMRTHVVATQLDGLFEVTMRVPASARLRVEVLNASGERVASATARGASRLGYTIVCGSRTHRLRVTRLNGAGAYTLTISKP
jgi:hypothetical protein